MKVSKEKVKPLWLVYGNAYRYVFVWSVFILIVCGINGSNLPKLKFNFTFGIDKLAHFILFGVEAWLLLKAFQGLNKKSMLKYSLVAAMLSAAFGVLIEILQATVFVNRTYDYEDMLANAIGAFLSVPLSFLLTKKT